MQAPAAKGCRKAGARLGAARFLDAARRWDVAVVSEALRAHPDFARATDRSGRTALHLCAGATPSKTRRPGSAATATAKALLAAGSAIDAVQHIPDSGELFPARPLWHAVARGLNRSLARFLLKQGANPDYCLWAVVWNDDLVTAKLLKEYGANLDLTFHGETPLLYAIRLRRTRIAKWLLRHGADTNLADDTGRTPLLYAVKRRYSLAEVEGLLKHGANPSAKAADGSTPLALAATARDKRLSTMLATYAARL